MNAPPLHFPSPLNGVKQAIGRTGQGQEQDWAGQRWWAEPLTWQGYIECRRMVDSGGATGGRGETKQALGCTCAKFQLHLLGLAAPPLPLLLPYFLRLGLHPEILGGGCIAS